MNGTREPLGDAEMSLKTFLNARPVKPAMSAHAGRQTTTGLPLLRLILTVSYPPVTCSLHAA